MKWSVLRQFDNWHIFVYNIAICHQRGMAMLVKTTIFTLCNGKYKNLSELAKAMGISVSQIYRVREGTRNINQKFIIGAIKAFPEHQLADLFYLTPEPVVKKEPRIESTRQTLESFASSADAYAHHLRSHISATINLKDASRELKEGAKKEANKVPSYLAGDSVN